MVDGAINAEWVAENIREVTATVFSAMLGLEVAVADSTTDFDHASLDGVLAMVGFSGKWKGAGMLLCTYGLAHKMAAAMLMCEEGEEVPADEVLDALGEMANILFGNFKEQAEAAVGRLRLGVPTVVSGDHLSMQVMVKAPLTKVVFRLDGEDFEVRLCVELA